MWNCVTGVEERAEPGEAVPRLSAARSMSAVP